MAITPFEGWNHTLSSARVTAKLRQLPIVEVIQPKGEKPLYSFGGKSSKYYVVTSAPKTLVEKLKKRGIKAEKMRLRIPPNLRPKVNR